MGNVPEFNKCYQTKREAVTDLPRIQRIPSMAPKGLLLHLIRSWILLSLVKLNKKKDTNEPLQNGHLEDWEESGHYGEVATIVLQVNPEEVAKKVSKSTFFNNDNNFIKP